MVEGGGDWRIHIYKLYELKFMETEQKFKSLLPNFSSFVFLIDLFLKKLFYFNWYILFIMILLV